MPPAAIHGDVLEQEVVRTAGAVGDVDRVMYTSWPCGALPRIEARNVMLRSVM